jgi:hypothetical protein
MQHQIDWNKNVLVLFWLARKKFKALKINKKSGHFRFLFWSVSGKKTNSGGGADRVIRA